MSEALAPAVLVLPLKPADSSDDLHHFYCCDPNVAHCGADLSDIPEADFGDDDPNLCVVCADLDNSPCPNPCHAS